MGGSTAQKGLHQGVRPPRGHGREERRGPAGEGGGGRPCLLRPVVDGEADSARHAAPAAQVDENAMLRLRLLLLLLLLGGSGLGFDESPACRTKHRRVTVQSFK